MNSVNSCNCIGNYRSEEQIDIKTSRSFVSYERVAERGGQGDGKGLDGVSPGGDNP